MSTSLLAPSCIALQPVCDRQFNHVADELIYRPNETDEGVPGSGADGLRSSARAYITAFYEIGLAALVGTRNLLVPVPEQWVLDPEIMALPTDKTTVVLPAGLVPDAPALAALARLREQGYTLLADDVLIDRNPDALLERVQIVRIDARDTEVLVEKVRRYARENVSLMACQLQTLEQYEQCRDLSFSSFQGDFYAIAHPVAGRAIKRAGNRAASLQLLRELYLPNPELKRIESLLVQDPHLCALLFKRANAASGERLHRVTKLQQVIMMLGFDKIRALTITLLLAHNEPVKRFLVLKALVRAAMARRLARHARGVDPDTAFTAGFFSMMEQIEGTPLEALLKEARLDPVLEDALLRYQGELGKVLKLVLAFENARLDREAVTRLDQLNGDYLASVAWAQEIMAIAE